MRRLRLSGDPGKPTFSERSGTYPCSRWRSRSGSKAAMLTLYPIVRVVSDSAVASASLVGGAVFFEAVSQFIALSLGGHYHRRVMAVQGPERSILEAIREALMSEMERDERVLVLGMDVGRLGGVFRVTKGFLQRFGPDRVFDTPLAEGAIVGASLGLALGRLVPVAEIQFLGFMHQAFHQIGPQLARYRYRSRGRFPAQVTLRAPFGGGARTPEFHPDSIEAQYAQTPGIKVVCPAFLRTPKACS
jgi:hypothetical protein